MAQTLPFHSVRPGTPNVFHNSDACEAGKRIERDHWHAGDGGRPGAAPTPGPAEGEIDSTESVAVAVAEKVSAAHGRTDVDSGDDGESGEEGP